ncbi:MAG: hypothetical protein JSR82_10515 [Verrucomicrobia bacterium]|nr:hypothetical protein [Verrucomicrobiota bacterium]
MSDSVPPAPPSSADTLMQLEAPVAATDNDIVFNCPHCGGELVVDRAGAGMTFNCPHCGGRVTVPPYSPPSGRSGAGDSNAGLGASPVHGAARLPQKKAVELNFDFSGQSRELVGKRIDELKFQLKENQSQTTEMRGHLNRAVIEMNRLQLKLQKLQDRGSAIEQELVAAKDFLEKGAA